MSGGHYNPRRKRIRIDRELYREPGAVVAVTIATHRRRVIFENSDIVQDCLLVLKQRANAMGIEVLAYCFMPDHLHLLARVGEKSDLVDFIRDFKGRTSRTFWNHDIHGTVWQRSFYDHILRETDDQMKHVRYIIENPVRAGIVAQWGQFRYSGSLTYDLTDPEFWEPGW